MKNDHQNRPCDFSGGVYFDVCFECEKGGVLEVK